MPFAHTLEGRDPADWEPLEKHLHDVSRLASQFASAFGAAAWGKVLGAWHDLGKYSEAFQEYLLRTIDPDAGEEGQARGRVDHSTFGAQHAARTFSAPGERAVGQLLAFCIAGHHSGLTDATADDESAAASSLKARLAAGPPRFQVTLFTRDVFRVHNRPRSDNDLRSSVICESS